MNDVRVAVIGGGHLGSIHARLLQEVEGATLVAVADPDGQAQQRLSGQVKAQVVADYRTLRWAHRCRCTGGSHDAAP